MVSTENWDIDSEVTINDDEAEEKQVKQPERIVPGYIDFDDYVKDAFDAMRAGIKAANNLPTAENFKYYSRFSSFNNAREIDIKTVLNTMQKVLSIAGVSGNITKCDTEGRFDLLLEANDRLLDQAGTFMDEESGITHSSCVELVVSQTKKGTINGSWNAATLEKSTESNSSQAIRLLAAKNVQRPQLMFKDKIDNSSKPWRPKIKEKPNALKPLNIHSEIINNIEIFSHPYEYELNVFEPPEAQLEKSTPIKYKSLAETTLKLIETPADVKTMIEDLGKHTEIAVDLEHHSYRSFQGITCLMQISTRDTDYLIDTLLLRSDLHELNEIFTKKSILKVFHGADCDIEWLQKDLSLYVVNMFDTHQAAKQLNLPYLSLAYLLKRYCGIDPNKHFQLADWRIRPLPEELIKYAREDTHYLLYIKDILRNDLIESANGQTNILKAVYQQSTQICKKTYVKPIWTEDSYLNMYRKSHKMFNNRQLYALKELHKWRDITARQEDDSIGYVLPNHMLLNIADTLPREMQGILACCNPIPPLVRQNLLKLHKMILTAREQPLIKPVLEDDLRKRLTQGNHFEDSYGWIYTPHDIPNGMEARADLPCLLNNNSMDTDISKESRKHIITVFDSPENSEDEDMTAATSKKKFHFVSPFERYKRVLPMIAEQEAKERERLKREEESNKVKEEQETVESINRVYEHFQKVAQEKKPPVPLSQMPGTKRKRDSGIKAETESCETRDDLTTPIPDLNKKMKRTSKKEVKEIERRREEEEIHRTIEELQEVEKTNPGLIRSRAKGEKKMVAKELAKKGMMPRSNFDYKSIDFSSFQGGSVGHSGINQVEFTQKAHKKGGRGRNRKKQKLNI